MTPGKLPGVLFRTLEMIIIKWAMICNRRDLNLKIDLNANSPFNRDCHRKHKILNK